MQELDTVIVGRAKVIGRSQQLKSGYALITALPFVRCRVGVCQAGTVQAH
ncbi:hypothetical protein ACT691_06780 [Vibrio metschnikovii]